MQYSWVYIMASKHWTLYTGVTSDLTNRVWKHKIKHFKGFSAKYNCDRLVYSEQYESIENAIAREKQIKRWRRSKKLALIQVGNPALDDLAADWFDGAGLEAMRSSS